MSLSQQRLIFEHIIEKILGQLLILVRQRQNVELVLAYQSFQYQVQLLILASPLSFIMVYYGSLWNSSLWKLRERSLIYMSHLIYNILKEIATHQWVYKNCTLDSLLSFFTLYSPVSSHFTDCQSPIYRFSTDKSIPVQQD